MAQIATITNPLTGQPAQVDQLDHTAQEIDDGITRALPGGAIDQRVSMLPGQSLVDNGVFIDGCLVDQRGGYVVPPNMPYYNESETEWVEAGTTDKYYTAKNGINNNVFRITIDGTNYMVPKTYAVRGYTGAGPTIDRWCNATGDKTVLITEGGLYFPVASDFFSNLDLDLYGKTITYSVLTDKGIISITATMPNTAPSTISLVATKYESGIGHINMYARDPSSAPVTFHISFFFDAGVTAHAAKLELGTQQTLAHQDADGNWVLNELPNYADTLARCQRYFVRMSNVYASGHQANGNIAFVDLVTPVPMRTNPVINVAGMGLLSNNQKVATPNSIILAALIQNHVYLNVNTSENMTFGNAVCLHDAFIDLSAEL